MRTSGVETTASRQQDLVEIVSAHQTMVWRYLRLLGCEPHLAEDLTQETFLRLVRMPPGSVRLATVAPYLRRLARNLFIDEMRRRRRKAATNLDEADAVWEDSAGEDEGDGFREALRECLARVTGRPRLALALRYGDRAPIPDVAREVGMTVNGVKALLGRVKSRLRDCIERRVRDR